MLLIVTQSEFDPTVDNMEIQLRARGVDYVRWDPASYPVADRITHRPTSERASRSIVAADRTIDLDAVTAVWFRRPGGPRADDRIEDPDLRRYVVLECHAQVHEIWQSLTCLRVPADPMTMQYADRKTVQLRRARELGFVVPDTLVTNDPDAVLAFHRRYDGNVVAKLPSSTFVATHFKSHRVFTEMVSAGDLADLVAVRRCPVMFQARVPKALELRVTIVGNKVFACESHSQTTNRTRVDWRHYDRLHTPHLEHALPADVSARCVALMRSFGLTYSAMDLILTPDGEYVFLENNPSGQYLWIEDDAGLPITAALCDLLTGGAAA